MLKFKFDAAKQVKSISLTNGILGKNWFGWGTRISSSQLILSHHPEFILAALYQVLDTVLSGWVKWVSGDS